MRVKHGANSSTNKLMVAFGHHIITSPHCQNSMAWGKKLLATQPHGTLLLANKHVFTRGRQGRQWVALPGQLLLTYLVKQTNLACMTLPDEQGVTGLTSLYYALNLGLCRGLYHSAPATRIKWPNDCVIHHKKVAGMLLEAVWNGSEIIGLVLGIGVNVRTSFADHADLEASATSLSETTPTVTLAAVQQHINQELTTWYRHWHNGEYEKIWQQWHTLHLAYGSVLRLHTKAGSVIRGTLTHLAPTGGITLRTAAGDRTLTIADI